jgi:hypothetical protein
MCIFLETLDKSAKVKIKLKVTLQLTVGQSVYLGAGLQLGLMT